MIFNSLLRAGFVSFINRIAGMVVGLLFGVVIIAIMLYGVAIVSSISLPFREWCNDFLKLNQDTMTLARWLYEKNLLNKLYHLFF
jgi:hypothetical protein